MQNKEHPCEKLRERINKENKQTEEGKNLKEIKAMLPKGIDEIKIVEIVNTSKKLSTYLVCFWVWGVISDHFQNHQNDPFNLLTWLK